MLFFSEEFFEVREKRIKREVLCRNQMLPPQRSPEKISSSEHIFRRASQTSKNIRDGEKNWRSKCGSIDIKATSRETNALQLLMQKPTDAREKRTEKEKKNERERERDYLTCMLLYRLKVLQQTGQAN